MAIEDIKKELEQRFNEPLPEFYKRRIIFWNDEEGEFLEEIQDFSLENAKVLVLRENNQFASKKLLSSDDLDSNYLVYNPIVSELENDWFLDLKLFSEEYRSDITSRYMQEMGIENTPSLRKVVKQYTTFFKAASRRALVKNMDEAITTPTKVHMAVVAALCGVRTLRYQDMIKAVLMAGNDVENGIKLDLLKYGASEPFWAMVNRCTGYCGEKNMDDLNVHILLSACSKTLAPKVLSGLENRYNDVQNSFCYDLVFEWLHSDDREYLFDIARYVEGSLHLYNRFMGFTISELIDTECLPCIDEVILNKMMEDVINNTMNADSFICTIESRRTCTWYERVENYYAGLLQVANMRKFYEAHLNGFHLVEAKKLWNSYITDYYQMDVYYRLFHVAFSNSLHDSNDLLDDNFKSVADQVENEYKNWFLAKLAENWTNVVADELTTKGYIEGVRQQKDFYYNNIRNAECKTFVIISDALRYEVASSLFDQLSLERSQVELETQQAMFPTITKFGMAALLPSKELSLDVKNDTVRVLADGYSTEMNDREAALKRANENSIVLRYKDILSMKGDERREAVKGMDVVYIYHDTIDSASHNDNTTVFNACDNAINELKNLVNMITSSMNGINIIITSDHGFLYTYKPLNEEDKMERSSFAKDIVEQGRRYVLTNDKANPDFLIPIQGFYNEQNLQGFAPRENIRIKGAGSVNFVHGGISLQEMVVPVIKYKYLRAGYKSYLDNKDKIDTKPVTIALLSSNRKISNMIINLSFYQKEAVSNNYIPCNYDVFIVNEVGNAVSDKQKIVADKTSNTTKDREFKCTFNLKPIKFDSSETYYLMIQDEKGLQIPIKEEFQIDIAFAMDEFEF